MLSTMDVLIVGFAALLVYLVLGPLLAIFAALVDLIVLVAIRR